MRSIKHLLWPNCPHGFPFYNILSTNVTRPKLQLRCFSPKIQLTKNIRSTYSYNVPPLRMHFAGIVYPATAHHHPTPQLCQTCLSRSTPALHRTLRPTSPSSMPLKGKGRRDLRRKEERCFHFVVWLATSVLWRNYCTKITKYRRNNPPT